MVVHRASSSGWQPCNLAGVEVGVEVVEGRQSLPARTHGVPVRNPEKPVPTSRVRVAPRVGYRSVFSYPGVTRADHYFHQTHCHQILKELAVRLKHDVNLHYESCELEIQKLMMGKCATWKIHGVDKADGEDMKDEEEEDALDARKGKWWKVDVGMEEKPYKPRVYKWRAERKK
ncbi:hypothetical protein K439DRAFT_1620706 [Ramaria rubella]|nr:hypothetical protein K439DRAFT_1620706 [Ramaria rubella]